MFLLDTSVLIEANKHDFPLNENPGSFWDFIERQCQIDEMKIPESVIDEIYRKDDIISAWVSARKEILSIPTTHALPHLSKVLEEYGIFSETDLEVFDGKADPFIIAEGLASKAIIITNEKSRPEATSVRKKKIPDICNKVGVQCIRYPRFLWEMSP